MKKEPVWEVYDKYRDAYLNILYYKETINKYEFRNRIFEIVIAISVSGIFASSKFFTEGIPAHFVSFFMILAAILVIIKPIINYSKKISICNKVLNMYYVIYKDLEKLKSEIHAKDIYNETHKKLFHKIIDKYSQVSSLEPTDSDEMLIKELSDKVNIKFPAENFHIPQGEK